MAGTDLAPSGTGVVTGGGTARPALRRCTAVDPDLFAASVWGQRASLSRAAELAARAEGRPTTAAFGDLLSLDAADHLLSGQGLRTPFLRVAKDGTTLPAARFTTAGGVGATIGDQVSDVRLAKLFAEGSSIVLQALHRTHAPVIDFAQALGSDLGHPVQVNAYITPPQSQGFSAHYDTHDVFVLQVAGQKRWRIHAPVHPAPLRDQPWTDHRAAVEVAARAEPLIDEVLEPGDALYLPRGFLHAATALGETSAHLTAGIHVWTRRHLLERILAAMEDVEELRAVLPMGIDVTNPDDVRQELELTSKVLAARLSGVHADRAAAGMVTEALASAKAAPVGPLAQARAAAAVRFDTPLRWRPALAASVRRDGENLLVITTDGTVRLPAHAETAVARLRAGAVLTPAELATETEAAGQTLARQLLTECLVVPA